MKAKKQKTASSASPTSPAILPAWLAPVLIAIACVAAYYPVVNAGFLSDDFNYLYGHAVSQAGAAKGATFFRPFGLLSLRIDHLLYGESATGYHITNILLHFFAAWGIALCASRIIRGKWSGLIAGLIFALHPIHPEAVSWISGRFDVLCGALVSWAFVAYLSAGTSRNPKRFTLMTLSYILFALACFTKEMAFAFPFVLAAYVFIIPSQSAVGSSARRVWQVAGFFIVTGAVFILRAHIIGGIGGYSGYENASMGEMLYFVLLQPFYWLFLPLNRSVFGAAGPMTEWIVYIILISPLIGLLLRPQWKVIAFGAAAIVLSTLPVAQIGYVDVQMQSSRFLYIPSLFFAILATALLYTGNAAGKLSRYRNLLAVVYLLVMLLVINQNNFAWHEAGRVAGSAASSAIELVHRHDGEWGREYTKLVVYNLPDAYLGAYVFREGFVTMLRHRTGHALDDVEIQVILEETGRFENVSELKLVFDQETVVWFFNDVGNVFEEITEDETLPG